MYLCKAYPYEQYKKIPSFTTPLCLSWHADKPLCLGVSFILMDLNSYELSRNFFDWSYENPELINPNHIALYFFIIEHCNRLGWKEKFGLPTTMAKDAIGIKNYKTYSKTLTDLIEWGFIKLIEKSTNQYSSNIVALVKNTKAHTKALSKATLKHHPKQVQSIDSIYKPINLEPINLEPITNTNVEQVPLYSQIVEFWLKEFKIGWTFSAVHGKALKSLISKIKKIIKDTNKEPTDILILATFKKLCTSLPDWYKDKDLQIIDSKFNEIITQIQNGTQQQQQPTSIFRKDATA